MNKSDQHNISLLVNNKPGVLIRIALVFARRGYNIDSCVVSPANDKKYSRMTITASGDIKTLDQIIKQLNKVIDVIHAMDHTGEVVVERELALIKLNADKKNRTEILQISDHFKCNSIDLSSSTITLECTGNTDKLDALLEILEPYGILEMVRTGKILMARGRSET
ncbi:MAG: acetolactate synthase small subunit [Lentisphaeria bacterium]|nr:acetolactate synthase small subunit [Lentisphaeria bacterium]NQZ66824.1 acetolactate synthase small subunit [Lentisphaeria bacterium]